MKAQSGISYGKIFVAIAISVLASAYLIYTNLNYEALQQVEVSRHFATGLLLCALCVLLRDGAYMIRLHELSGKKLSWWKSLQVIMLWEFGSAFTYGAVGGKALMLYVFKKEKLGYGKAVFVIMLTSFLDNLIFLLVFAGLFAVLGTGIFNVSAVCHDLDNHLFLQGLRSLADKAWIGFLLIAALVGFLFYALFLKPEAVNRLARTIGHIPLLKRWQTGLNELAHDIHLSSKQLRGKSAGFWFTMLWSTLLSWLARFALANAVILAFSDTTINHLQVLARQFVLWFYIITPTTPGASGTAEASFMAMNCEFIAPGLSAAAAVMWRVFGFYIYLAVGALVFSRWVAKKHG